MPTSDENGTRQPKILIPEVRLQARVAELAQEINHDFRGRELTAICILKGSFIFFSDLIRRLDLPITCEFLGVSSYGNKMVSSGEVKVTLDIKPDDDDPYAILTATDQMSEQVAQVRVPASFKLTPGTAAAWIENEFKAPRA